MCAEHGASHLAPYLIESWNQQTFVADSCHYWLEIIADRQVDRQTDKHAGKHVSSPMDSLADTLT